MGNTSTDDGPSLEDFLAISKRLDKDHQRETADLVEAMAAEPDEARQLALGRAALSRQSDGSEHGMSS
jgi:hypothetical protein